MADTSVRRPAGLGRLSGRSRTAYGKRGGVSDIPFIPFEAGEAALDWFGLTDALAAGHDLPKAEIADTFLYRGPDTLLNRAAWIDGLGLAVKSATVFPRNAEKGASTINGGVTLYSD